MLVYTKGGRGLRPEETQLRKNFEDDLVPQLPFPADLRWIGVGEEFIERKGGEQAVCVQHEHNLLDCGFWRGGGLCDSK